MHPAQVLFSFILAFMAGIAFGSYFGLPETYALPLMIVGVSVLALAWRRSWRIVFGAACFLCLMFGLIRAHATISQATLLKNIVTPTEVIDKAGYRVAVTLRGFIDDEPVVDGTNQRLRLYAKQVDIGNQSLEVGERVLVTTQSYPRYEYGQQVVVSGALSLPYSKDESFDYASYLAKDSIFTTMGFPVIEPRAVELSQYEKTKISLLKPIQKLKQKFELSLQRSLDQPHAALISGLLLGSRTAIPDDVKDDFRIAGVSHILAVSGYNITIVAGIIASVLLFIFRRPMAFWFSLVGIFIFTILTGAEASIVRAALMGSLLLFAQKQGRLYQARNGVMLAGAVMLAFEPQLLRYDVGFQLSFAATLGLIYISPKIKALVQKVPTIFSLKDTLTATLAAQIAVLPFLVYHFKALSLVSLPANILILPLVPFAMLAGFMTGILGLFSPMLARMIGFETRLLSLAIIKISHWLAQLPYAQIEVSMTQLLVVVGGSIVLSIFIRRRRLKSN